MQKNILFFLETGVPKGGGGGGSDTWEKFPKNPVFFLGASCQVFNLYVWESEAEEQKKIYSCIVVNFFFCSQYHCFREYSES